jgi:elongation factor Ts
MAEITAQEVKKLREMTGQGMMDCKKALQESEGDFDKAVDLLRKQGKALLTKRAEKAASEGLIGHYIHHTGKVGVIVEVNCETDFVANSDPFKLFVSDLAMHICAANPLAVDRERLHHELVEKEKQIIKEQVEEQGKKKPENIIQKIVDGKLEKFFEEVVLLEQPFVKDDKLTIRDLIEELASKTGERILIKRFARFAIGG